MPLLVHGSQITLGFNTPACGGQQDHILLCLRPRSGIIFPFSLGQNINTGPHLTSKKAGKGRLEYTSHLNDNLADLERTDL